MRQLTFDHLRDATTLSRALKAVRRLRNMTGAEVASGMNISVRTYERFESGQTRMNLEYLHRFAEVTDSDFYALLCAATFGTADFAVHCADNQLAAVLASGLRNLIEACGPDLAALSTRDIIETMQPMFEALSRRAEDARLLRQGVLRRGSAGPASE